MVYCGIDWFFLQEYMVYCGIDWFCLQEYMVSVANIKIANAVKLVRQECSLQNIK